MLFGLHELGRTKEEHVDALAAFCSDETVLIILDTNVLSYLYKLHQNARNDFYTWAKLLIAAERLVIPAWSATEYFSTVRDNKLTNYLPRHKEPDQIKNELMSMYDTASAFVDDAVLKKIGFEEGRAKFLDDFKNAIDGLAKFTKAFKHEFSAANIHQEIQANLGDAVLRSDIAKLCAKASNEGPSRLAHRIPPGYYDGNKQENSLGDVIIWFELLQYASETKQKYSKVLFVSNDQKKDWVYAPVNRVHQTGKVRKIVANRNPEIKVADPRLVAEFERVVGHSNFMICSLQGLVESLSRKHASDFSQLAAAIQIDSGAEALANELPTIERSPVEHVPDSASTDTQSGIPELAQSLDLKDLTQTEFSGTALESIFNEKIKDLAERESIPNIDDPYLECAYKDKLFDVESGDQRPIREIISQLRSHNWYTQNPAIDRIKGLLVEEFDPSSWFVLGRNIYQAACGNALKAARFIENLDRRLIEFPAEIASHLLNGIVYEIYFDSENNFRRAPKASLMTLPVCLLVNDNRSSELTWILEKLKPHSNKLWFVPGSIAKINVQVQLGQNKNEAIEDEDERRELISIKVDGVELIEDIESETLMLDHYTRETLKSRISSGLAIPATLIELHGMPITLHELIMVVGATRRVKFGWKVIT